MAEFNNTGVNHLYPDGVPIFSVEFTITDLYKKIARKTSLAVQTDPWFDSRSAAQKVFSELHGSGDRISYDFLKEGAYDVLPVFQSMQRWLNDLYVDYTAFLANDISGSLGGDEPFVAPIKRFEFDSELNPGKIIYRWENMDTRYSDYKNDYTSRTLVDIRIDPNTPENVENYVHEALKDYVIRELYDAIGYDKKYMQYSRKYSQDRREVAFWAKNNKSLQTQYNYAGV